MTTGKGGKAKGRGKEEDGADERRAAREEQRRREREWTAEFERRAAAADAARAERERAERNAALRAAWVRGTRGGNHAFAEVAGPDGGEPVRIAVVWPGRHRAARRAFRGGPTHGPISDPVGLLLVIAVGLVPGLDLGVRRLVLRLSDRPRWAVVAAVGAKGKPTLRTGPRRAARRPRRGGPGRPRRAGGRGGRADG
ncbi:hypothetical protein ABTX81_15410 [Kitasatospora sp. NPDC097605]|uniref:hypothetical protein n=1 Tax=Kitasatospora sp. NPDC097605 TaxID=3157226 RepID=UPI00332374E4